MKTMKKILLLLAVLLGQQAWVFAENRLYIEDFQISPGATKSVSVILVNDGPAGTMQFKIALPDGLSWGNVALGTRTSTGYSLNAEKSSQENMVFLTKSASVNLLAAGTGSVLTFDVTASSDFEGGNITLSSIDIETTDYDKLSIEETSATVTVQLVEVTATESVNFTTTSKGTIEVSMSNNIPVSIFSALIQLPTNISYVENSLTRSSRIPASAECQIANRGNGLYKVQIYTTSSQQNEDQFSGSEGIIFSFEISAEEEVADDVIIKGIEAFNPYTAKLTYPENVTIPVTVESSEQTVVLDAENDDELKFEAGKAEQVKVIRKLAEKGKWSTIVLPFTISKPDFVKYAFAEGATDYAIQVANINYVQDIDIDGQFVKDTGKKAVGIDVNFKTGNRIKANTPTLIKVLEDGYKGEFTVPNVTLSIPTINEDQNAYLAVEFSVENYPVTFMQIDQEDDGWINNANVFMGTYKKMTNIGGSNGTKDYYIKDNKFYQCVNTTIKPTRAFFSLHYSEFDPSDSESLTNVRIKITDEEGNVEEVTAIDNVQLNTPSATDSAIYNLQGQRVKTAQKGLYIQNGKKYLVR